MCPLHFENGWKVWVYFLAAFRSWLLGISALFHATFNVRTTHFCFSPLLSFVEALGNEINDT